MAYDFKNDPGFKEAKSGMYGALWRTVGWSIATAGLVVGGIQALVTAVAGIGEATAATVGAGATAAAVGAGATAATVGTGAAAVTAAVGGATASATAAVGGTALLATVGLFALAALALGAAIYTGYKAYKAHVDERAGFADISAQRGAARMGEVIEKQQQVSLEQAQNASMEWQKKILAARAAAAAGQNTGKTA